MNAVIVFTILSLLLVIGGILGLVVVTALGTHAPADVTGGMRAIPGFMINVIFATLFLGAAAPKLGTVIRFAFPQLCLGQIIAWGQYVVGLGLAGFVFTRWCGVPAAFGNLLEREIGTWRQN